MVALHGFVGDDCRRVLSVDSDFVGVRSTEVGLRLGLLSCERSGGVRRSFKVLGIAVALAGCSDQDI